MSYCINPQCQKPQNPTHALLCQSCGSQLRLKDRYRAIRILGQSQWNRTFLAVDEDKPSQPRCVIKQCLYPPSQPDARVEFRVYTRKLDPISQHPALPDLLASFEEKDCGYIVQDYISGRNLAEELEQEGVFQELQIWYILSEILPLLQFIHEKGMIHGDIKPENIIRRSAFIPPTKPLILVDFAGIYPQQNFPTTLQGSPEYAAPEQLQGEINAKTDLYSLGITCLHLLTQMSPFDLFNIKTNTWVWRDYLKRPISQRLTRILTQLIERNPSKRYPSATAVMQDLKSGPIPVHLTKVVQRKWILTAWGGAALALFSLFMSSRLPSIVPQISSQPPEPIYQVPDIQIPVPQIENFAPPILQNPGTVRTLSKNTGPVWSVAVSPDGQFVVYGNTDGSINIIDANTGGLINTLLGHSQPVGTLAMSRDGRTLVSGSGDQTILVWDLWSGRQKKMLYGHQGWVYAVAISPDGETVASVSRDQTIRLWDIYTGRTLRTLNGYGIEVQSLAFSGDNQTLVSGGNNGIVDIWNWHTGELLRTFKAHTEAIWSVAISPDGQRLATGSWDHAVKLWDLQQLESQYFNNTPEHILLGHQEKVQSVAFSPDGQTLASGDFGGGVKLWNVENGGLVGTFKGHQAWVNVVFNPQNHTLITGSFDDTLKVWPLLPPN
ncbi:serine/threonine-protein kinase [Planktothrix pseudagardhii]|uniref:Vegetative incompatibility protein HET-E-1 n=1 Tax=Planktothrix pseudagardhii TaxID=132604 RepID=A0A9W4CH38_9CYAN|nr:serine/threonine-protein kinase [Planktothrix pseudagardhii]CAD5931061.1 Vegetative incompatibility protein HET-E-1 [Planktothrix pseudagardhii]